MYNALSTNDDLEKSAHANDMDVLGEHLMGREYPSYNVGSFGLGIALHNRYISFASLYRAARAPFTGFPPHVYRFWWRGEVP